MKFKRTTVSQPRIGQEGFSLVEVIIGVGLIGLVVIALYSALTSAFAGVQLSRQNLRATEIMVEKMDSLRLYTWSQVTSSNFIPREFTVSFDPKGNTNGIGSGIVYQGKLSIIPGPSDVSYNDDLKWVIVTLSWKTGSLPRQREFKTLVCRNGLHTYLY